MTKIGFDLGSDTVVEEETTVDHRISPHWNVILWNDAHHTFEFVIGMITKIFKKELEEALVHTLEIHEKGRSILTTCSKERGLLYLEQISTMHERHSDKDLGPLNCTIEPTE